MKLIDIPGFKSILGYQNFSRFLFQSSVYLAKKNRLPPRPKVNEDEIEEVFIKGGGSGGQKINKTNSKVQLRHVPTGIVISAQPTRSREQNRKKAREIIALKLEEINDPENCRTKIIKDLKVKSKKSKLKKSKRKYQRLAEEKKLAEQADSNNQDDFSFLNLSEIEVEMEMEQEELELNSNSTTSDVNHVNKADSTDK
ncbi:Rso55p ASCRUDRAFT_36045 [Ascoidea rubescens DSM 1968]|uniref:Prokaryotic-type class I peptide chain release factors domain-containing protein n=1 Tax=Ascoidea rubescens DSM 1968 TaxID=1344418 RepID=A0A1D2VFU3_9ASCO|nr:hypothetical protein ASCRUDRAFT_36045 [Ascoidea rubescens DSM 1968]ODV60383.1 hypothetical protein ASCRUDRAFT_36045 [Ascoidea rubescens DSM 1968]